MVDVPKKANRRAGAPERPSDVRTKSERQAFLFEHMPNGVAYARMFVDEEGLPDWEYLDVNPAFHRVVGLSEVVGKRVTEVVPGIRESNPELFEAYERVARTGEPEGLDVHIESLGLWLYIYASSPTPGHFLAVYQDINDRKKSEQALSSARRRLETANERLTRKARALRLLSLSDQTLVRATDEDQLLHDVCNLIVAAGGYAAAWVGYAIHDAESSVAIVAKAGDDRYLSSLGQMNWGGGLAGATPIGTSLREGRPLVIRNLKTWKTRAPWKRIALSLGYHASLDLPIRIDGVLEGALEVWAPAIHAFDEEEVELFEELAANLGFGIASIRAHGKKDQTSRSLDVASLRLEQMVLDVTEVLGRVVEARDPYTHGHQERVAGLAKLIALEMGLSGEDIITVEVAGLVHDVGKMKVPVEILSTPGRLDEVQYSIVKEHSRAGFEILKDVAFPWPVAEIVLQHHERADGSGYPNGLHGEAILPLARILAVADVVEALSSHRPQRPAISVAAAVEEVRKSEGKFDPEVVASCVRLQEAGRIAL